jgi:hypothetical protein
MNGPKVGDPAPVLSAATLTGDLITRGDFLWIDSGNANAPRPASAYTWDTNLLTTQTSFKLVFAGIALSDKPVGSVVPIRIGTAGEYDFDQASGTGALGDLMGPAKQSGNLLENQKVAVAVVAGAIGRRTKVSTANVTKTRVRVRSSTVSGVAT